MLQDQTIAFIGAGQMAEAMIGGLLRREHLTPDQIIATAPREERRPDGTEVVEPGRDNRRAVQ